MSLIGELDFSLEEEETLILTKFNDTYREYPKDKTIVELFEEQVARTPDAVALVFEEKRITYQELNDRVNVLAYKLRDLGVKVDDYVGIITERSIEMIVGIYGVIKAGGAYVPLDPNFPKDRIDYILKDCQPKALLTNQVELNMTLEIPIINLNHEDVVIHDIKNPERVNGPGDSVYLIYTSGTTGAPKGVMVEHKNLHNFLVYAKSSYVTKLPVMPLFTNYTFDLTVTSLFLTLIYGGKLMIYNGEIHEDIKRIFSNQEVTSVKLTPSQMKIALLMENDVAMKQLETLVLGGEELSTQMSHQILEKYGNHIKIHNEYGPTETTVGCCGYVYQYRDNEKLTVSIGRPIDNTQVYILDGINLCGIGISGELCIAGAGVTRGYLNRPELTAEKFIDNPYGAGKLYRTGDLARFLPDGNIEYLGRSDDQINIRGLRIELGEIENIIRNLEQVIDAVAIVREDEDGEKAIHGYYVGEEALDVGTIQDEIQKKLPEYMIPSYMKQIDQIPITPNGKLDYKALPAIKLKSEAEYVAPRNEKEVIVCSVFKEILGINFEISINDNFFLLGGDSIKALRIVSKLRENGFQTDIRNIMKNKTPRHIGENIEKVTAFLIDQGEVVGNVALTPIQKDFILNGDVSMHHFNQSVMLESQEQIDEVRLRNVLNGLVAHHDMLRATYDGQRQEIKPYQEDKHFALFVHNCTDIVDAKQLAQTIEATSNEIQRSINLETGPLLKVGLFQSETKDYLLMCIHHLVVDGVSLRILLEDLTTSYQLLKNGKAITLPKKTNSFKEWRQALGRYYESDRLKKELPYWEAVKKQIESGNIVFDKSKDSKQLKVLNISLSKEKTSQLLYEAPQSYYADLNDILLTSVARGIARATGNKIVSINLEGHGREEIGEDVIIDRTVGWFTSMYPVVLNGIDEDIEHDICYVKETLRRVPGRGIGYGVLKSFKEGVLEGVMPTVTFNYLGEFVSNHQDELFLPSRLLRGDDVSCENTFRTAISIDSVVVEGTLMMMISYDASKYTAEFMNALYQEVMKQIDDVLEHCLHTTSPKPTASDFGELTWSLETFKQVKEKFAKQGDVIEHILPLTGMQEGMLFHKLLNPKSTEYVNQITFAINSVVSEALLEQSLNLLITKHQSLRSRIVHKEVDEPRQVVLKERAGDFTVLDASEESLQDIYHQDVLRGFDLESDHLLRMILIKLAEAEYRLIVSAHHIILDGWSTSLMMNDFLSFYDQLAKGKSETDLLALFTKQTEYSDYIHHTHSKGSKAGEHYWQDLLSGYEGKGEVPSCNRLDVAITASVKEKEIALTEEETTKLEAVAQSCHVTINTVVEASWGILLQRYNHEKDVIFGKVVSGRNANVPGIEQMVGLFINTIPVRVTSSDELTFKALMIKLQEQALASGEYDHHTLADIQRTSGLGSQLIQTVLVFENYFAQESKSNQLNLSLENSREEMNYDLSITAYEKEGQLRLQVMYQPHKYSEFKALNVLEKLKVILQDVSSNPDKKISAIQTMPEKEKQRILFEFNQRIKAHPMARGKHQTVVEQFEQSVATYPNRIALTFEDAQLTYSELNEKANALAHKLRKLGIKPDDYIAIVAKPSTQMIIGIYGIIKAGGAYVPIDPSYPTERVAYIIEDSNPKVVLTYQATIKTSKLMIDLGEVSLCKEATSNLVHLNQPSDLIYCMYTSGTTGKPKGVMVEHRNVVNYVYSCIEQINLTREDCVLQQSTPTFDIFVEEVFPILFLGGKLAMITKSQMLDQSSLITFIKKHGVTLISVTPQLLKLLNGYHENLGVKRYISGGDVLRHEDVDVLATQSTIYNGYGPTECTVATTFYQYDVTDNYKTIPIGKPITNAQVYIMNDGQLCGIGIPGELCIGGEGVARGYLNRPELTNEKFIRNPYSEGKLYKTGDLARFLPDGNIEYLGRKDDQIKIRGYRIELGEIEHVFRKIEDVTDVAVIVRPDKHDEAAIHAYFIAKIQLDLNWIKAELKKSLPVYMIPPYVKQIDEIPVTLSGKLNRLALPTIELDLEEDYLGAANPVEQKIIHAYAHALALDPLLISTRRNFFQLGGDSISLLRAIMILRKEFEINLEDFYSELSISELSELITNKETHSKEVDLVKEKRYTNKALNEENNVLAYQESLAELKQTSSVVDVKRKKMLLLGATGFLGAHLLLELLETTQHLIVAIVRGKDEKESIHHLRETCRFYFDADILEKYGDRIVVYQGDLSEASLGLEKAPYLTLSQQVDTIMNAASNVKHYGKYDDFYKVNVLGVKHLIDFQRVGREKTLVHCSTVSLASGYIENLENFTYTEDTLSLPVDYDSVYLKTKAEAEALLFEARAAGLKNTIIRLGNLQTNTKTGKFQINDLDNAFMTQAKGFLKLGIAPDVDYPFDYTPINDAAQACVRLMDIVIATNPIYHIYNPHLVHLKEILTVFSDKTRLKFVPIDQFQQRLLEVLKKEDIDADMLRFGLHAGVLKDEQQQTQFNIQSEKTNIFLEKVGFNWGRIEHDSLLKVAQNLLEGDTLKNDD